MNFTCTKSSRDGIYHVRIYSVPRLDLQNLVTGERPGSLARHWRYIRRENTAVPFTKFDEALVTVGTQRTAIDGELLLGTPQNDTLKITLGADPVFFPLVAEMRDPEREVWVEIVLEQKVVDAPTLRAHEMFWPRKKRMWFWGKLLRHDSRGTVGFQELQSEGEDELVRTRKGAKHKGKLDLAFVHWLNVKCSEDAKPFLLAYRQQFVGLIDGRFKISDFLYKLVEWISPTDRFFVADDRLVTKDVHVDGAESISRCNFRLSHTFKGDAPLLFSNLLYNLEAPVRFNSGYFGVFAYDTAKPRDIPQYSFFAWKDLKQALFEITREFFLRFQVEIPTLEESAPDIEHGDKLTNTTANRDRQPAACARWLFLEVDSKTKRWHGTTFNSTIEYQPAAQWIKKIRIDQPTSDKFLPLPDYDEFEYPYEGGQNVSYRTLFRFMGQSYQGFPQTLVDDPRGWELWVVGTITPFAQPVRSVEFKQDTTSIDSDTWTAAHLRNLMALWGGTRSVIKFDARRIGIEPYGASNDDAPQPVGTFGIYDWGEFPLLRQLDANIGLLFGPDPISATGVERGEFSVFEIARTPDGHQSVSVILRGQYTPVDLPEKEVAPPPPPDDPPPYDPPNVTITTDLTGVLTGTVPLAVTVVDVYDVLNVRLFVNGAFVANLTNTLGTLWEYSWNTAAHPDGTDYVVQVQAINDVGLTSYDMATSVEINN